MSKIESLLQTLVAEANEEVLEELLIVTPNKRLSRYLHRQYGEYQSSKGLQAWQSLACVSFSAWIQQLWDAWLFSENPSSENLSTHNNHAEGQSVPEIILSNSQEISLWQDIIQQYCDHHPEFDLFNSSATTRVAKAAWQALREWQQDGEEVHRRFASPETEVFSQWAKAFRERCESLNVIDSATQLSMVRDAVARGQLVLPRKIVLLAFDEMTPLASALLQAAKDRGVEVQKEDFQLSGEQRVSRLGLSDSTDEIQTAACWALKKIEDKPEASVGIVIPELASNRDKVEYIFRQVFEPQYVLPSQTRHATGFNMSAGQALANTPPIAAALLALKLNLQELDIEDVSLILHSPFLGAFDELSERALLNADLRKKYLKITINALRAAASDFSTGVSPASTNENGEENAVAVFDFYTRLQQLHAATMQLPRKQKASGWAETFMQQLRVLGWPGQRSLDTLEFQQVNVWHELLNEFCMLDAIYPSLSLSEAIQYLTQLAQDTQFQAQTKSSPVQVLGVLEAAGMLFDHLWVMNLDNDHWPPPPSPNALLPVRFQKEQWMPRSSAEKELALAQRLTERFASSATEVIFSYPMRDGDKALAPSALIESYLEITPEQLNLGEQQSYALSLFGLSQLETIIDDQAPPVPHLQEMKGGTQILKDQAACPFRSFAKHRLAALENEDAVSGLSAADRGSLIHNALEDIWKRLQNQEKLLSLSDLQLDQVLNDAIQQSFYRLPRHILPGQKLKLIEHQRMFALLRAWMELEKQRSPFSVVHSEASRSMKLAGLPISIRYDRVDQLEDGKLFIVDYKTGKLELRQWAGDRPDEPQVPVYCVANEDKVSAAAIGQINVEDVTFKGLGEDADTAPGLSTPALLTRLDLPDNWQGVLAHWHEALENLATEFMRGEARVDPKHQYATCQYCALHSLCRINDESEMDGDGCSKISTKDSIKKSTKENIKESTSAQAADYGTKQKYKNTQGQSLPRNGEDA